VPDAENRLAAIDHETRLGSVEEGRSTVMIWTIGINVTATIAILSSLPRH
jgi:hypothetical protein